MIEQTISHDKIIEKISETAAMRVAPTSPAAGVHNATVA